MHTAFYFALEDEHAHITEQKKCAKPKKKKTILDREHNNSYHEQNSLQKR